MKKAYKILLLVMVSIVMMVWATQAFAFDIVPFADEVFDRASITLYSDKTVTFSGKTFGSKDVISVTACSLEEKDGNRWYHVTTLTPPDHVARGTFIYDSERDYGDNIPKGGPYRIKATFNADGYKIVRYSNERSF